MLGAKEGKEKLAQGLLKAKKIKGQLMGARLGQNQLEERSIKNAHFSWREGLQFLCLCGLIHGHGVAQKSHLCVGETWREAWEQWWSEVEDGGEEGVQASMKACFSLLLPQNELVL